MLKKFRGLAVFMTICVLGVNSVYAGEPGVVSSSQNDTKETMKGCIMGGFGGGLGCSGTVPTQKMSQCGLGGFGCYDSPAILGFPGMGIGPDGSFLPCSMTSDLLWGANKQPYGFKTASKSTKQSRTKIFIEYTTLYNRKNQKVRHWYIAVEPGKETCLDNVFNVPFLAGETVSPTSDLSGSKYNEIPLFSSAVYGDILRITITQAKTGKALFLHYQFSSRFLKKLGKLPHGLQYPVYSDKENASGDILMEKNSKEVVLPNGHKIVFNVKEAQI